MWQAYSLSLFGFLCCYVTSEFLQAPLRLQSSAKHLVLKDDIVQFHKNLTQIESITYNEEKAGEWLVGSLESQGYSVERQHVDSEAGRFNVYAYLGKKNVTEVLLSSHYDTVRSRVLLLKCLLAKSEM